MNDCKTIHETVLKDVLDLWDDIKDLEVDDVLDSKKRSKFSKSSLAKLTSNLVLEFPVLCSRTLSFEAMTMTAKAIERKCVVMLQLLFSAYQLTDAENALEYISTFHKNIKLADKITVDDMVAGLDRIAESMDITVDRAKVKAVQEDMKNIYFEFKQIETSAPLSSYSVSKSAIGDVMVEAKNRPHANRSGFTADNNSTKGLVDMNDVFKKQLLDSDIKKANELVPSTLVFNLITKTAEGRTVPVDNIVVGVKARMIPIDSTDIINHVITKVEDKNWLLQLIRATTREISFFKDFVFAIDRAKIDALSRSRRGSANPMWKVLERRAIMSRGNRLIGRNNDVMAITSLVMSQEEIDYVRKEHNMDLEAYSNMASVMEAYNFMAAVIIDESLEVAKFLFDSGDGNWENYSFRSLERESSDNEYKKIVNLMTKVAR